MMREVRFNPVTEEVLVALRKVVGEKYVKTDADVLDRYKTDEEVDTAYHRLPEVAVWPGTAEEIGEIMKIANTYGVPVTPRSAGTSVSCGAIPAYHGIVLLMERLNRILEVNEEGMYMVVEAGVRTSEIQKVANERGLLYAGDPCSSDSCFIGGNLATNAGGNKAVRYGTTRHQVYSIEAVLPDGSIGEFGARLKKCSTGYCLDQLIIGSEGTLGIITKATLKLLPLAPYRLDVLAIFTDLEQAVSLVPKLVKAGIEPTSVEFMDNLFVRYASDFCHVKLPHYEDGLYDIISIETFSEEELERKMELLDELCTSCGAVDIVEADDRVWNVRRNCLEGTKAVSRISTSDDLVVPIDKIGSTILALTEKAKKYDFTLCTLAHAGDGNLHFQLLRMDMEEDAWHDQVHAFRQEAYAYVYEIGGRLSGEHGIGMKKVEDMKQFTPKTELAVMKAIKNALDPKGILNPGKVLD